MKKGFTLIEMLGSIVILAILVLVAFPAVLNLIGSSQNKLDDSIKDYVISVTKEYVEDNVNDFPKTSGIIKSTGIEVEISDLKDQGYLSENKIKNHTEIENDKVTVKYNGKKYIFEYNEISD